MSLPRLFVLGLACGTALSSIDLATSTIGGERPASPGTNAATTKLSVDRVTKIDGTSVDGNVVKIDSLGGVWLGNATSPLKLDELAAIERPTLIPDPAASKPTCSVELLGGGRLLGAAVTIRNQQCELRWPEGEPLTLPVELVAAIRLQAADKDDPLKGALAQANRDVDRIFVNVGGAVQAVEGLIESLDANELSLEWQGKIRKLARRDVQGMVLAVVGKPPQREGAAQVSLRAGSSVPGRIVSLADGKLTIEIAPKVQTTLPWSAVSGVAVRSSRLAYLSDLDPVEVIDEPIATLAMPWQRDKSAAGKRLTIAGRTFEKGLGVHARSLLRYDIDGRFDEFVATIGIDAEAAGRGDCNFLVQADGQELLRQRVRGNEPALDIKLKISGAKQLTLIVEPGEDLDLADHADWANARLLRLGN